jgi:hypothetical protein
MVAYCMLVYMYDPRIMFRLAALFNLVDNFEVVVLHNGSTDFTSCSGVRSLIRSSSHLTAVLYADEMMKKIWVMAQVLLTQRIRSVCVYGVPCSSSTFLRTYRSPKRLLGGSRLW